MSTRSQLRVLFTGYAPVHFVCFRPLYERLLDMPDVKVSLSGGLRSKTELGVSYDEIALYEPFQIESSKVLPTTNLNDLSFDVLFAANTKMIAPARVDARVQIFHGVSFRNKAIRPENMNADHFFMIGPYMKRGFVNSGLLNADDSRALPIGFMKTDRLLNGDLNREAIVTELGFDGSRPILLYAPTGQKHNSLETMGEAVIERIASADKYDLIVKPHDHPKRSSVNWFERLKRFAGPHTRISRNLDVIPLLLAADLLITDASSVSTEFALLDRPIVFLDVPRLLERARDSENSQLDLNSWGRHVGVVVEKPDNVTSAIDDSLADPGRFAARRQAMASDLFYNPGHATQHAIDWLTSTFGVNKRPAAAELMTAHDHGEGIPAAPRIRFSEPSTLIRNTVAGHSRTTDLTGEMKE